MSVGWMLNNRQRLLFRFPSGVQELVSIRLRFLFFVSFVLLILGDFDRNVRQ